MITKRNLLYAILLIVLIAFMVTLLLDKTAPSRTNHDQPDITYPDPSVGEQPDTEQPVAERSELLSIEAIPEQLIISPMSPRPIELNQLVKITGHFSDGIRSDINESEALTFSADSRIPILIDPSGSLSINGQIQTGDSATVTITYKQKSSKIKVTFIPSLEETVTVSGNAAIVTNPNDVAVVVNKHRSLEPDYVPEDLVRPDVPFSTNGELEKHQIRQIAADALEDLFLAAGKDGIRLYAVSGYRSYRTQDAIFRNNLRTKGEEHTLKYSAKPGHSEHQTGLAMDVSAESSGYDLIPEFGETAEGEWLRNHAADHGFIIRYLQDKEDITGYAYEPWHLRYVGVAIAREVAEKSIVLEEYMAESIPAAVLQ